LFIGASNTFTTSSMIAFVISCKKCDAQPTGAAQTLLRVASQHPEALLDLQKV
jgi:hypothetical protein